MPLSTRTPRALGCLLGLAIGDALGAPLEGLSSQQIRAHYGNVAGYVDGAVAWKRKPYRWRMPGLYTDDTQQALALTDVLIACGRVDADRLAAIYLDMANPKGNYLGAHRGVGSSFRKVLARLESGISPRESGGDSAGIGAAMRIAPVAVYFADDPEAMYQSVLAASLMTHVDIRSLSGAMAVASTVRRLVNGEERDPSFLFRVAGDVARAEDRIAAERDGRVDSISLHRRAMSASIAHVESILDLPRDRAFSAIVEEANRHGAADPGCRRPTLGFPPALIPTCLYLLVTTDSFEEALLDVVNLGGDADTAGAILGAFAGAYYGVSALPERLLQGLHNRDGVTARAHALDRRDARGLNIPDLIETERRLGQLEEACRDELLAARHNGGDLGANRRI